MTIICLFYFTFSLPVVIFFISCICIKGGVGRIPRGYFHIRRSGGLNLASVLEEKFGVRSPNKRKNLGSSGAKMGKNWDIIPGKESYIIVYMLL